MLFISQRFQQFSAFINPVMKGLLLFLFFLQLPLLGPLPPDGVYDDVEGTNSLPERIIKVNPGKV